MVATAHRNLRRPFYWPRDSVSGLLVDDEVVGDWYGQVWLRDDNTYQLEFRDRTAAEHYQTRTISQEKVIVALSGWVMGRPDGKDAFMWNNIGASFESAD